MLLTAPDLFWIHWVLTGDWYDFKISFIIQLMTTIALTIEFIVINIFFIMLTIKCYEYIVHIKSVVITNVIVIILECVAVLVQFLIFDQCFAE